MAKRTKDNGVSLGFERQLWAAADKLRGNMEPSDYKHVVLGLIFLKYISDAFEAKRAALLGDALADAEDPEEYLAENVFWVPPPARWSHLQARARQTTIGKDIDDAMLAIEASNASLKGVLPKDYARPALNKVMLGELIDLVSGIGMAEEADRSRDILGRVYEYFLGRFAGAEGKRGGEFYTPRSVVRLLVEMLEPYRGRVYDPCCGSGGMFVQSERFVEEHGGRIGDIAIYGQESNYTTWRLARMNLAVRGIDADIRWNNEGSFHRDELPDLKADFILANPPFNVSDWGGERLRDDARWAFGAPPAGNANYAWLQHIHHHLAPNGMAGVVLANGSMSTATIGRGRHPPRHGRGRCGGLHDRPAGPALLLDADSRPASGSSRATRMPARVCATGAARCCSSTPASSAAWWTERAGSSPRRTSTGSPTPTMPGAASPKRTPMRTSRASASPPRWRRSRKHGHVLTPGRYVGAAPQEDDGEPFAEKMTRLVAELGAQQAEGARLDAAIATNLEKLGFRVREP